MDPFAKSGNKRVLPARLLKHWNDYAGCLNKIGSMNGYLNNGTKLCQPAPDWQNINKRLPCMDKLSSGEYLIHNDQNCYYLNNAQRHS
jgi:hypothetical protein